MSKRREKSHESRVQHFVGRNFHLNFGKWFITMPMMMPRVVRRNSPDRPLIALITSPEIQLKTEKFTENWMAKRIESLIEFDGWTSGNWRLGDGETRFNQFDCFSWKLFESEISKLPTRCANILRVAVCTCSIKLKLLECLNWNSRRVSSWKYFPHIFPLCTHLEVRKLEKRLKWKRKHSVKSFSEWLEEKEARNFPSIMLWSDGLNEYWSNCESVHLIT